MRRERGAVFLAGPAFLVAVFFADLVGAAFFDIRRLGRGVFLAAVFFFLAAGFRAADGRVRFRSADRLVAFPADVRRFVLFRTAGRPADAAARGALPAGFFFFRAEDAEEARLPAVAVFFVRELADVRGRDADFRAAMTVSLLPG